MSRGCLVRWSVVVLLALVGLTSCANAPAPPPETTAVTQVQAEELLADLERIAANKGRVDAQWAQLWGAENAKRIKAAFDVRVQALVAGAEAESRPVTADAISALIADYAATTQAAAAAIEATRQAAADPNLDVAAERARLLLDYVTEISERERAVQRARKALKLAGVPLPASKEPLP